MLISNDPIDRLAVLPAGDYETLSILFITYGKLPRMHMAFGDERAVLIDVINKNPDALRTISIAIKTFEQRAANIIESRVRLEAETKISGNATGSLTASLGHAAIREMSREQFTLLDQEFKAGVIATMLNISLAKHEQQGTSFISTREFDLLSSSYLKIIQLWEQASVCHRCPNFEQIVANHPFRESNCSNLTVLVLTSVDITKLSTKNNVLQFHSESY